MPIRSTHRSGGLVAAVLCLLGALVVVVPGSSAVGLFDDPVPLGSAAVDIRSGCALLADDTIECFDAEALDGLDLSGAYSGFDVGGATICLVSLTGDLGCRAASEHGAAIQFPDGQYRSVVLDDAGRSGCAIGLDDSIICIGEGFDAATESPPADNFSDVAVGDSSACGLRTDGTIVCWGQDHLEAPEGVFSAIDIAGGAICTITARGSLGCLLEGLDVQVADVGTFVEISVEEGRGCARRTSDQSFLASIECFNIEDPDGDPLGAGTKPPLQPVDREYIAVDTAAQHACAVSEVGAVHCWDLVRDTFQPVRLMDTRDEPNSKTVDGRFLGDGLLPAGHVTELDLRGRGGFDPASVGVALNITTLGATAPGFITAYPCGRGPIPRTSSANYEVGGVVARSAIVGVGTQDRICLFNLTPVHLIVDMTAQLSARFEGSSFFGISPERVFDSRDLTIARTFDGKFEGVGTLDAREVVRIDVTDRGLSLSDGPIVANVTITDPQAAGFVLAFDCSGDVPKASTLNFRAGQIVSNTAIVGLDRSGAMCVYASVATELIVDVTGSFECCSSEALTPARLADSRRDSQFTTTDGQHEGFGAVEAGETIEIAVSRRGGLGTEPSGVAFGVVAVDPEAPGYLTAYPCNARRPDTSSVNFLAGDVVANLSFLDLGTEGTLCVYASARTDIVVDVFAESNAVL